MTVITRPRPPADDPSAELAKARCAYDLVERVQAGDKEAFGLIYTANRDAVFRFIYFRTGNRQQAEDFTHDVFVKALGRIDQFQWQGTNVAAWLITIARNLVVDYYKSSRHKLEVLVGEHHAESYPLSGTVDQPEEAAVAHLSSQDLLSLLLRLVDDQQTVLILRFLRGMSVLETAQEMGKNVNAIKALQYRAVRALARHAVPALAVTP